MHNNQTRYRCHVICSNCGIRGHVYRSCKKPTISLGIIAFRISTKDTFYNDKYYIQTEPKKQKETLNMYIPSNIRVLLIRRRNTFSYIDFVRGRYNINPVDVVKMLKRMTIPELNIIINKKFGDIWNSFWINHNCNFYKNDYKKCYEIYIKHISSIRKIFNENKKNIMNECLHYQEWELPKGRRNTNEIDNACAKREFIEETGYTTKDFNIVNGSKTINEQYTSYDNVTYLHKYYTAIVNPYSKMPIVNNRSNNLSQIGEISDIGWFTIKQALNLIQYKYKNKKNAILKAVVELNLPEIIL